MHIQAQKIWTLIARKLAGEASAEDLRELAMALRDDKGVDYKGRVLSEYWQCEQKASRAADQPAIEAVWKKVTPLNRQARPLTNVKNLKLRKDIKGLFTTTALYQKSLRFPLMLLILAIALFAFLFTPTISTGMINY